MPRGLESLENSWERGGGPFCGLLFGGAPVPLAEDVTSAQLGRHDTAHLHTPLLLALLWPPWPLRAIYYLSFAAIARN
jgi:hypothetical protein